MRRHAILVLIGFLWAAAPAWASTGKVCKVLPQILDKKGRQSLSPSLYERDAYQVYLRKHPAEQGALHVVVQYKARGLDWEKARLRAELRGLLTNSVETVTLEKPIKKSGFFGGWAQFNIAGADFKKFGELVAWRITLWEGGRQVAEQESFLWTGVAAPPP